MFKILALALRFNPLELVGGFLAFGYSIVGIYINNHAATNENFVSAVSMYGDLLYYFGGLIGLFMIIFALINAR